VSCTRKMTSEENISLVSLEHFDEEWTTSDILDVGVEVSLDTIKNGLKKKNICKDPFVFEYEDRGTRYFLYFNLSTADEDSCEQEDDDDEEDMTVTSSMPNKQDVSGIKGRLRFRRLLVQVVLGSLDTLAQVLEKEKSKVLGKESLDNLKQIVARAIDGCSSEDINAIDNLVRAEKALNAFDDVARKFYAALQEAILNSKEVVVASTPINKEASVPPVYTGADTGAISGAEACELKKRVSELEKEVKELKEKIKELQEQNSKLLRDSKPIHEFGKTLPPPIVDRTYIFTPKGDHIFMCNPKEFPFRYFYLEKDLLDRNSELDLTKPITCLIKKLKLREDKYCFVHTKNDHAVADEYKVGPGLVFCLISEGVLTQPK